MNLVAIHQLIDHYFNLEEVRQLAFQLEIDFDNLAGETKSAKTRSLILHLSTRNKLDELKAVVLRERPHLTWPTATPTTPPPQPTSSISQPAGIQLDPNDRSRLIQILTTLPEFRDVRSRIRFIDEIFAGVPRSQDIVSLLDLDGNPRSVASGLITRLCNFGQNEPGQETLGLLINKMIDFFGGGDNVDFLKSLFLKYPLHTTPAISKGLDDWGGGNVTPQVIQEKVIGENTLKPIHLLELALEAANAVVRIRDEEGAGTGFVIADRLIMTNNHVIGKPDAANNIYFDFNYQLDTFSKPKDVFTATGKPGGFFYTNPTLDFTIIEVDAMPPYARPLKLSRKPITRDDHINIIQHPGGHYKKISMQNNFVASFNAQTLYYVTTTKPGSSGSPIFDNQAFLVVGIHHSSRYVQEDGSAAFHERNAGSRMVAVLEDIRVNAQEVYAKLDIQ